MKQISVLFDDSKFAFKISVFLFLCKFLSALHLG